MFTCTLSGFGFLLIRDFFLLTVWASALGNSGLRLFVVLGLRLLLFWGFEFTLIWASASAFYISGLVVLGFGFLRR